MSLSDYVSDEDLMEMDILEDMEMEERVMKKMVSIDDELSPEQKNYLEQYGIPTKTTINRLGTIQSALTTGLKMSKPEDTEWLKLIAGKAAKDLRSLANDLESLGSNKTKR